METYYIQEAEKLEREAKKLREKASIYRKAKEEIKIGVEIIDLDTNKRMVVTGLRNGSNDFEADPIGGGIGRGYHYTVKNWRVVAEND